MAKWTDDESLEAAEASLKGFDSGVRIHERLLERLTLLPLHPEIDTQDLRNAAMHLASVDWQGGEEERINARYAGTAKATGALDDLAMAVLDLRMQLVTLPKEAAELLCCTLGRWDHDNWLHEKSRELSELSDAARISAEELRRDPIQLPAHGPGRKPKLHALLVTRAACLWFPRLTGLRPTLEVDRNTHKPCGPLYDFITGLFGVLEIDASPEACIRALMEKKDKSRAD